MPELRRDPVIGRWVIISTERAKRPNDFNIEHGEEPEMECPFCEGHEKGLPRRYLQSENPAQKRTRRAGMSGLCRALIRNSG
jgi:UDPglucose--hexose-1-phosphate uridylyltransferase